MHALCLAVLVAKNVKSENGFKDVEDSAKERHAKGFGGTWQHGAGIGSVWVLFLFDRSAHLCDRQAHQKQKEIEGETEYNASGTQGFEGIFLPGNE
jgi:hypothetical protein